MSWPTPAFWLTAAYLAAFLTAAFRHREFNWLWGAVLLWIGFGIISLNLLPGIFGLTRAANFYALHIYIALAACAVFLGKAWQNNRQGRGFFLNGIGRFLPQLAVSSLLLLFSALVMLACYRDRPDMWAPYLVRLLFDPVYWLSMQAVLMAVSYGARVWAGENPNLFTLRQLNGLFFAACLMQLTLLLTPSGILWLWYYLRFLIGQ